MKSGLLYLLLAGIICLIAYQLANNQKRLRLTLPRKPLKIDLLPRLDPVIVVACLFACQGAYGRPVTLPLVYLALFAFIISSPLFGRFDLPYPASNGPNPLSSLPAAWSRVLVRWGAIVAGLLCLAYAFNLGEEFSRKVLLTWFVVTPLALCVARAVRLDDTNRLGGR